MAVGTRARGTADHDVEPQETPDVSVCETCPGRAVFIEAGNTDGWIASDTTYDVRR